jgi:dUTP pyrophosphatase
MEEVKNIVEVESLSELKILVNGKKHVVVKLWAPWCGPCKTFAPIVNKVNSELELDVSIVGVDVDAVPIVAAVYGVRSIPTLLMFEDGECRKQIQGIVPEHQLKELIADFVNGVEEELTEEVQVEKPIDTVETEVEVATESQTDEKGTHQDDDESDVVGELEEAPSIPEEVVEAEVPGDSEPPSVKQEGSIFAASPDATLVTEETPGIGKVTAIERGDEGTVLDVPNQEQGTVSDVKVENRALTEKEIQEELDAVKPIDVVIHPELLTKDEVVEEAVATSDRVKQTSPGIVLPTEDETVLECPIQDCAYNEACECAFAEATIQTIAPPCGNVPNECPAVINNTSDQEKSLPPDQDWNEEKDIDVDRRHNHFKIKATAAHVHAMYQDHEHYHEGDAGLDLFIAEDQIIPVGLGNKIDLCIVCEPEDGIAYELWPRSSISKTPLRLANSIGLIDGGYRGHIMAVVDNFGPVGYEINAGTRLFQLVAADKMPITFEMVTEVSETARGTGGFGSTGA